MYDSANPVLDRSPSPRSRALALDRDASSFARPMGANLVSRTRPFLEWQEARREAHLWPFGPCREDGDGARVILRYDDGLSGAGIDFSSPDHLGLARSPAVRDAAERALWTYGTHVAGSALGGGSTRLSAELEGELGALLETDHVISFPTGWSAAYGTITALARRYDHVIVDESAARPLQEAARAATEDVLSLAHNDLTAAVDLIRGIRLRDTRNGILVVTAALFGREADAPRLAALQEVCRAYDAVLLVDVGRDLGVSGPGGTGQLGEQGVLGEIDLVLGSFAPAFATNGGFLAAREREAAEFVRTYAGTCACSNALSPIQVAVALEALRIIRSSVGEALRARVRDASEVLRAELELRGVECPGGPAPFVPVLTRSEAMARLVSRQCFERGCFVRLVEYPSVPGGAGHLSLELQAGHTAAQLRWAARMVREAILEAQG